MSAALFCAKASPRAVPGPVGEACDSTLRDGCDILSGGGPQCRPRSSVRRPAPEPSPALLVRRATALFETVVTSCLAEGLNVGRALLCEGQPQSRPRPCWRGVRQ